MRYIEASARTQRAKAWQVQYHMPRMASFTMGLYGDLVASHLGQSWCTKCKFLFYSWASQENQTYEFTPDTLEASNDPGQLEEAWTRMPTDHKVWTRVEDIKAMAPTLG